jgi:hypothetical protein
LGYNLAADDELIETIKDYFLTMLRMSQKTVCKSDPRAAEDQSAYMPSTHKSILGHSPADEGGDVTATGGDVTAGPYIEAFWFNNAYVPADDKTGGMTWMMDLLESCPLYQGIRTVRAYTKAEFSRDRYVDRERPDLVRISSFKTNLHGSLKYLPYTRSEWAIVTPLDFPKDLTIGQVGNYVWWTYRFCIDAEGAQKATNRDSC